MMTSQNVPSDIAALVVIDSADGAHLHPATPSQVAAWLAAVRIVAGCVVSNDIVRVGDVSVGPVYTGTALVAGTRPADWF